jgi:hypothetical protein
LTSAASYSSAQAKLKAERYQRRMERQLAEMEAEKLRLRQAEVITHRLCALRAVPPSTGLAGCMLHAAVAECRAWRHPMVKGCEAYLTCL